MRDPIPSTNLLKDIPEFKGFPAAGEKFLAGLTLHNDKHWFDKHRAEYETHLLAPMRAMVLEVGARLRKKMPRLVADPRVGSSIMRIARDTRFSANKEPYKTWIAARWWDASGPGRDNSVSFYFSVDAESGYAGGGIYQFEDDQLARYRKALSDPKALRALKAILGKLEGLKIEVGGQTLKRPPRGFKPDHPAGALMLHKGFYAGRDLSHRRTRTKAVLDDAVATYEQLIPLIKWLAQHVVQSGTVAGE